MLYFWCNSNKKMIKNLLILISFYFLNVGVLSSTNYYVNDGFTTNDIYCVVSGTGYTGVNSAGRGLSPSTPVLTLTYLFTLYGSSFAAGDTIKIDAGIYAKGGTPSVTTESKFNITVSGLTFIGAGMGVTTFSNNFHGGGTDYFMQINANNTTVKNMTFTKYYGGAPNSGTVYNGINTGGQVLSIYNATGVVIENVSLFDNGTNGNAAIAIGPNSTVLLKGGGSNCNATGSSYSGGIDAIGNAINLTIQNVIIAYNSKTAFGGAGLYVYSIHNTNIVNVKNSAFINNIGGLGGGAGVYCNGGNVTIRESSILSNTVSTSGGPYYVGAGIGIVGGTMTLTKCKISNNKSSGGSTTSFGGVGLTPSSGNVILKIDSCSFSGNTGQRTTGNDIGARINGSNKFSITINETTFSTGAIDIGGGSTNSCAGNTFKITNSGNPTITYSGSGPCTLGAGSNISSPYTFTSPTIPSFTGNCSNFVILPIELTRFEGECSNGQVILNWQTASEINNSEFKIERSTNGIDFEIIGSVKSIGASGRINNYNYLDEDNVAVTCYYRLNQKDYDGKTSISKIIAVEHTCGRKLNSEITSYPNPSNDYAVLDIKLYQTALVTIDIVDEIGRTIKKYDATKYDAGMTSVNLDLSNLNAGIYFLKVLVNDRPTIKKLVKL